MWKGVAFLLVCFSVCFAYVGEYQQALSNPLPSVDWNKATAQHLRTCCGAMTRIPYAFFKDSKCEGTHPSIQELDVAGCVQNGSDSFGRVFCYADRVKYTHFVRSARCDPAAAIDRVVYAQCTRLSDTGTSEQLSQFYSDGSDFVYAPDRGCLPQSAS